ncbi:MAG: hypothetical protein JST44_14115 [Cyanobacteria bacterium SZAS LIN-5]|nr:hypothetical protein [Cyanobacteria bacterium SZAS LIN-5]
MITRKQLLALTAFVLIGAVLILMGREEPSKKNKNDDQALLNRSSQVVNQKLPEASDSTAQNSVAIEPKSVSPDAPNPTHQNPTTAAETAGSIPQNSDAVDPSTVTSVADAFPQRPGREVFLSRCTMCHSLQSIAASPNLSREGWEKVVARMIKNHAADISSPEAKQIVDYLAVVKGSR